MPRSKKSYEERITEKEDELQKALDKLNQIKKQKKALERRQREQERKARTHRLIVIGDGFLTDEVQKKADASDGRAIYCQKVPYDRMWEYYAMADYFINLWDEEVFGMAILEAIYYMTPAFLISAPGPRVIAKNMKNSFICESVEEIADKISAYQRDDKSVQADRAQLIKEFSWSRFVENVNNCYYN